MSAIINSFLLFNKECHQNIIFNITCTSNILDNKQRKHKIIWFNPPYSGNVKTNIGTIFLSLLKKHFLKNNKLRKVFNKNDVKISYSCKSNISSIIAGHYKSLLQSKITKCGYSCRLKKTVLFRISDKPQI